MDFAYVATKIKMVIEGTEGCFTKTTPKKGEGFVPYNHYNLKWGQVDVDENRLRVVLDLYPKRYSTEELSEMISLPAKGKGERKSGIVLKQTQDGPPQFDALEISIYRDYFDALSHSEFNKLLNFIGIAAEESRFKSRDTSS